MSLADCIPLAAANIFGRPINIFSSKVSSPRYDIKPDMIKHSVDNIDLAYVKIRNEEHYDVVTFGDKYGSRESQHSSEYVNRTRECI